MRQQNIKNLTTEKDGIKVLYKIKKKALFFTKKHQ